MKDFCKDDFQSVIRYRIDTLVDDEDAESPITQMLEYWLNLKNGGRAAPRADLFDIAKIWQMKIPDRLTIIDCSPENPEQFKPIYRANDAGNIPAIYGNRITGQPLGKFPCKMHARHLQREYRIAKENVHPTGLRYQRIRQKISGYRRDYMRLLLPLAGPTGAVTRLVSATRLNHPTYFDPFPDTARGSSNRWLEW